MKLFVILSVVTTLAATSVLTDKFHDENLITHSDIGNHMVNSEPWNFWTRLGLQRTTPDIMARQEFSGLPLWMCKGSLCLHRLMLETTPSTMNRLLYETPNIYRMDNTIDRSHMPWSMEMETKITPRMMNMALHKIPDMHELNGMLEMRSMPWWLCRDSSCLNQMRSRMSPMMMQTMRMPTMQMRINHMIDNDRMTPIMQLEDMTPTNINTINHLMRMNQNLPLGHSSMMNDDMTTRNNLWNMYMRNQDILGHKIDTQKKLNDDLMFLQ